MKKTNKDLLQLSRIEITYSFSGARYNKGFQHFTTWELSVTILGNDRFSNESDAEYKLRLTKAYHRIYCWMECFLTNIFIIEHKETDALDGIYAMACENPIMMTPYFPSDDVIAQLLHSKISVISKNDLYIGEIKLKASGTNSAFYFNTTSSVAYDLPEQKDFVGKKALHKTPWWCRYDCDTYDLVVENARDRKEALEAIDSSCFFDEIEKSIDTNDGDAPSVVKKPHSSWEPKEA